MIECFGPIEYRKTINTYKDPDKKYYVGYVKNGKLETIEVRVDSVYINVTFHHTNHDFRFVKLNFKTFKNKLCKILNISSFIFYDEYIETGYIQDNKFDAKVAYLKIQSLNNAIDNVLDDFALEYPDVYLSKIQNYRGSRSYRSPSYEKHLTKGN